MRRLENRNFVILSFSLASGVVLLRVLPFPSDDPVLQIILWEKPRIYYAASTVYNVLLFSTPYIIGSVALSLWFVFGVKVRPVRKFDIRLPPFPEHGDELSVVLGEQHQERRPEPVENPRWVAVPARGARTGMVI